MEGITYPEHFDPGVSLDSRFSTGMLQVKPLPSLVHKISLVARPQVEIKTSHWKPVINPVMDIKHRRSTCEEIPVSGAIGAISARSFAGDTDKRDGWIKVSQSDSTLILRTVRFAVIGTDDVRNDDMNTDLPESLAPMLKSPTIFERAYVKSSALPTLNQGIIDQTDVI